MGDDEGSAARQDIREHCAVQAQDVPQPTTPAQGSFDWRSEAVRIFRMADKDQSGQLDMSELADVRRSEEYAEAMMHEADTDNAVGRLSEDEWLAHIKTVADKSQRSAYKLLRQYEKHINEINCKKQHSHTLLAG